MELYYNTEIVVCQVKLISVFKLHFKLWTTYSSSGGKNTVKHVATQSNTYNQVNCKPEMYRKHISEPKAKHITRFTTNLKCTENTYQSPKQNT